MLTGPFNKEIVRLDDILQFIKQHWHVWSRQRNWSFELLDAAPGPINKGCYQPAQISSCPSHAEKPWLPQQHPFQLCHYTNIRQLGAAFIAQVVNYKIHSFHTLVSEKSVQYVAQCLASADSHCACARFCYFVSPWVTFQKFWNNNWIKICVDCYFNIFMLRRRILQRKRKSRRKLSAMCIMNHSFQKFSNRDSLWLQIWINLNPMPLWNIRRWGQMFL